VDRGGRARAGRQEATLRQEGEVRCGSYWEPITRVSS
jgi:hypothetical protein